MRARAKPEPQAGGNADPRHHRISDTTMAAPHTTPPTIAPMTGTDSFNHDPSDGTAPAEEAENSASPTSPVNQAAPVLSTAPQPQDAQTQQRVHDVLHSDVGVTTLLSRLKASITSARVGIPPIPHKAGLMRCAGFLQLPQAPGSAGRGTCQQSQKAQSPYSREHAPGRFAP